MKRRTFITLIGGGAALWPLAAHAQQPALPVIGFLNPGSPIAMAHLVAAFKDGLAEAGYVEGKNVAIEYRWGGDRYDQLPEMAADLVRRKKTTSTIPIVVARAGDLVGSGLVGSLARPGGNITGFSILGPELAGKRLELLKEIVPGLSHVTVVSNPANPHRELEFGWAEKAAQTSSFNSWACTIPTNLRSHSRPRLKSESGSLSWGTHC
jgi:putative ABC transport system substrate-binding protein